MKVHYWDFDPFDEFFHFVGIKVNVFLQLSYTLASKIRLSDEIWWKVIDTITGMWWFSHSNMMKLMILMTLSDIMIKIVVSKKAQWSSHHCDVVDSFYDITLMKIHYQDENWSFGESDALYCKSSLICQSIRWN